MNSYENIIKGIEDAQLRETALKFNVGDTVKVKIKDINDTKIAYFKYRDIMSLLPKLSS